MPKHKRDCARSLCSDFLVRCRLKPGIAGVLMCSPCCLTSRPACRAALKGNVGPDGNIYAPTFGFDTKGCAYRKCRAVRDQSPGQNHSQGDDRKLQPAHARARLQSGHSCSVGARLRGWQCPPGRSDKRHLHRVGWPHSQFRPQCTDLRPGWKRLRVDSFNGVIWQVPPHGGSYTAWSSGPTLSPGTGLTPPFGANGVEFNNEHTVMYVADTAFHQIIQIPVTPEITAPQSPPVRRRS